MGLKGSKGLNRGLPGMYWHVMARGGGGKMKWRKIMEKKKKRLDKEALCEGLKKKSMVNTLGRCF